MAVPLAASWVLGAWRSASRQCPIPEASPLASGAAACSPCGLATAAHPSERRTSALASACNGQSVRSHSSRSVLKAAPALLCPWQPRISHSCSCTRPSCMQCSTTVGSSRRGRELAAVASARGGSTGVDGEWEGEEEEVEEKEEEQEEGALDGWQNAAGPAHGRARPVLSNAEMKELRAHAHRMGSKIVTQQVGKWGVTSTVVTALSDALEANELLKVRVSDNAPEEMADTVAQLEARLAAKVVGRIGRTLLLYRPSLAKLAQEQTKSSTRSSSTGSSRGSSRPRASGRDGRSSGRRMR